MDDDYDTPWKQVVTRYFRDFMAFYFADACAAIDWSRPYAFLDQELAAFTPDAATGPRILDKLVRVYLLGGGEQWVLVHLEVQAGRDAAFAERIFIYHYRVYDHYRKPVASLAVLADDGKRWRPTGFAYRSLGCEMSLVFPVVKLRDYADQLEALLAQDNPFALVTAAHLLTQNTRRDANSRHVAKWRLTRLLYARDWDKKRIIDLYNVIDWMMRLPDEMDAQFRSDVFELCKGKAMRYINNFERAAIAKGLQQGMEQGMQQGVQQGLRQGCYKLLLEQLRKRFGVLEPHVVLRLVTADVDELSSWALNFVDASSLDEVFRD